MTMTGGSRIRVSCEQERKATWVLIPSHARHVSDVSESIIEKLKLDKSHSTIDLYLDNAVLLSSESVELIRDGDVISVRYQNFSKRESSSSKRHFEDNDNEMDTSRKKSKVALNVIPNLEVSPRISQVEIDATRKTSPPNVSVSKKDKTDVEDALLDNTLPTSERLNANRQNTGMLEYGNIENSNRPTFSSPEQPSVSKNNSTSVPKRPAFRSKPFPPKKPTFIRSKAAPISPLTPKSFINTESGRNISTAAPVDAYELRDSDKLPRDAEQKINERRNTLREPYPENLNSNPDSQHLTPYSPFKSNENLASNPIESSENPSVALHEPTPIEKSAAEDVRDERKNRSTITKGTANEEVPAPNVKYAPSYGENAELKQRQSIEGNRNNVAEPKSSTQVHTRRVFQPYQKSDVGEISTIYGGAPVSTSKKVTSNIASSSSGSKSVEKPVQIIDETRNNARVRPSFGDFQPKVAPAVDKQANTDQITDDGVSKSLSTNNGAQSEEKSVATPSSTFASKSLFKKSVRQSEVKSITIPPLQKPRDVVKQPGPEKKRVSEPKPKLKPKVLSAELPMKNMKREVVQKPKPKVRSKPYVPMKPVITAEEDIEARNKLKLVEKDNGLYANNVTDGDDDCTILQFMKSVIVPKKKKEAPVRISILIDGVPYGSVPSGPLDLILGGKPSAKGDLKIISFPENILETLRKGRVYQRNPGKASVRRGKEIQRDGTVFIEAKSVFSFSFFFEPRQHTAERDISTRSLPATPTKKKKKGLLESLKSVKVKSHLNEERSTPKEHAKTTYPSYSGAGAGDSERMKNVHEGENTEDKSFTVPRSTNALDLDVMPEAGSPSNNLAANVLRGGTLPPLNLLDDVMDMDTDANVVDKAKVKKESREPKVKRTEKLNSTKISRKLPSHRSSGNIDDTTNGSANSIVDGVDVEKNFKSFLLNAGTGIQNVFEDMIAGNHV